MCRVLVLFQWSPAWSVLGSCRWRWYQHHSRWDGMSRLMLRYGGLARAPLCRIHCTWLVPRSGVYSSVDIRLVIETSLVITYCNCSSRKDDNNTISAMSEQLQLENNSSTHISPNMLGSTQTGTQLNFLRQASTASLSSIGTPPSGLPFCP